MACFGTCFSAGSTPGRCPSWRAWENPTVSEIIGACAGALVVFGTVALVTLLTWKRWWKPLWVHWLTSPDHKNGEHAEVHDRGRVDGRR